MKPLIMRFFAFGLLVAVGVFGQPSIPASAHTLRVDGQIGVTLHIEPDDEPVAGEPSKLLISVQDKTGAFSENTASCVCTVSVMSGDSVVDTLEFVPNSEGSSQIDYTFQSSGRHTIEVTGESMSGNAFQQFAVSYNYRVGAGSTAGASKESEISKQQNPLRNYIPFIVIGAMLFTLILFFGPRKNLKNSAGKR